VGFFVGCCRLLGRWPHWPPREDQDRLLLLVLPAVIVVELAAAIPWLPRWLAWLLRLAVAAGTARILLDNTSYVADLAGPGTREWSAAQTWLNLGGLAAALAALWALLALLARRAPVRSIPLALALTTVGAAVIIMYSGYSSGGQLGFPLAGALAGVTVASLALSGTPEVRGALGVGIVGLFALLVIGCFFGKLTPTHAALLFFGPLLCWLPELPYVRRLRPWLRGLAGVILTAVPVAVTLVLAQQQFIKDSAQISPSSPEPSVQDYLDFGK
jgi:hypothetical protein